MLLRMIQGSGATDTKDQQAGVGVSKLKESAQAWWVVPDDVLTQAMEFDERHTEHWARANRAHNAVQKDVTSITKAAAFQEAVVELERSRYIEPKPKEVAFVQAKKVQVQSAAVNKSTVSEWSLEQSIWAPRVKWSDAKDFYDTEAVQRSKVESCWQHALEEQGLAKIIKDADANANADREADQVMRILWDYHDLLFCCFEYYACLGNDPCTISYNAWSQFVADCGLVSNESKFCKKSDIDRLVSPQEHRNA